MKAFEQLLEAVEYSTEINVLWTEQFSTISEARSILNKAKKELIDEYDIARLAIAMNKEPPDILEVVEDIKKECFSQLREALTEDK